MINDYHFEIWIEFEGQEFIYSKLYVFFFTTRPFHQYQNYLHCGLVLQLQSAFKILNKWL